MRFFLAFKAFFATLFNPSIAQKVAEALAPEKNYRILDRQQRLQLNSRQPSLLPNRGIGDQRLWQQKRSSLPS